MRLGYLDTEKLTPTFELGPIRPPSEAYSLLIRATRNCPWNKCLFCSTYKGSKFELRAVEEIKKDIESAKAISEGIKEIAWRKGYGNRVKEVAAMLIISLSMGLVCLMWLHGSGQEPSRLFFKTPIALS